jgi:hypothetical protein
LTADGPERLHHAAAVLTELFPAGLVSTAGATHAGEPLRSFGVLPGVRHPRLLVPLQPRQAATTALKAYGGRLRPRDRLAYRALGLGLRTLGSGPLPVRLTVSGADPTRGTDIDARLAEVVSTPVSVAVHLTPARANRKPIVQALSATEPLPLAFAKVATNDLTDKLVNREVTALAHLRDAGLRHLVVPEVLDHRPLNGRATLVMRPLPTWSKGRRPNDRELADAAAEVAAASPRSTSTVGDSAFWRRLRADIDAITEAGDRDQLQRSADHLEATAGTAEIEVGAGHGDWSPWNMWQTPRGLLVWDWERFTTDAPIGSDLIHYRLQELLVIGHVPPLDAARGATSTIGTPLIGALHLLGLAVRYDQDGQATSGALPPSAQWLLPAADEAVRAIRRGTGAAA